MAHRLRNLGDMRTLFARALECGAQRVHVSRCVWDISHNCERPHVTILEGRPSGQESWRAAVHRTLHGGATSAEWRDFGTWTIRQPTKYVTVKSRSTAIPLAVELLTRCRRCGACRRQRSSLWYHRAVQECSAAPRTWFGTLTCRPEVHHAMLARARSRLASMGEDFDALDYGAQFRLRAAELGKEVTKYIKRLRKQSNVPLRYLLVVEQHAGGGANHLMPHLHMLVHEVDADRPIRHRMLSDQWPFGFTQWKLIADRKQAGYVTKYLSKDAAARVRASRSYGTSTSYDIAAPSTGGRPRERQAPLHSGKGSLSSALGAKLVPVMVTGLNGDKDGSCLPCSGLSPGRAGRETGLSKACAAEAHSGGSHAACPTGPDDASGASYPSSRDARGDPVGQGCGALSPGSRVGVSRCRAV